MISIIILFFSVVLASAMCSMYEAAILSTSLIKVETLVEDRRKGSEDLLYIKQNIHVIIATIVVVNNAINICGSIFIGQLVAKTFGDNWLGISSAFLTFAIIIISEIIPKSLGQTYRVTISLAGAKLVRALSYALRPIVMVLLHFIGFKDHTGSLTITEKEIKTMLRKARDMGEVEADEEKLCQMVFRLNDLKAKNIMKPIEEFVGFRAERSLKDIRLKLLDCRYSRIGVFSGENNDVVGVCQHKDLLVAMAKDNDSAKIKDFSQRPIFVYDYEKADDLLFKFQMFHKHLFIVKNIKGAIIGIITMEDILEELFGEIYDEKDIRAFKKDKKTQDA